MYTYEVGFTKSVLDGPLAGMQIRSSYQTRTALKAFGVALWLNQAGVLTDDLVKAPWTAVNIDTHQLEEELPELAPVDIRQLDAEELAELMEVI
jgi:hypothetical protein